MTADVEDAINAASAQLCNVRSLLELADAWMNHNAGSDQLVLGMWIFIYDGLRAHLEAVERALELEPNQQLRRAR